MTYPCCNFYNCIIIVKAKEANESVQDKNAWLLLCVINHYLILFIPLEQLPLWFNYKYNYIMCPVIGQ